MSRSRRVPPGTQASPALATAVDEWQAEVVFLDHVDPVTTELTRLRSARRHECIT